MQMNASDGLGKCNHQKVETFAHLPLTINYWLASEGEKMLMAWPS